MRRMGVIRPAILWNDGRSKRRRDYLNQTIGLKDKLSATRPTLPSPASRPRKILWMKKNEPENFARICRIMLPKDYLQPYGAVWQLLHGLFRCLRHAASGRGPQALV
ncbi:MAG: FGGY family carbohydrate kinase [Enterocloster clostridioformis]